MKKLLSVFLALAMLLSAFTALAEDLNSYTLDEIIAKAKEEGHVESVGMPDSWANWGDSWKGLTETYGIAHTDDDMSSAEELNMFANDSTRDIGDVGLAFTQQAIDADLVQGYKTSYWDSVPDWAKGEDGKWMIAYTGCTAFIYNNDLCADPAPASWEDVRKGSYKLTIGDVVGGATGQGVVIATAFAFGGDLENLQPAYDFWTEMAKAGRIDSGDILLARIQAGEVQCGVSWSWNVLNYRDSTPNYNFTLAIPSDGSVMTGWIHRDGMTCVADEEGIVHTGWISDGHYWYYADESGILVKGWFRKDGKRYHADENCIIESGWVTDPNAGTFYLASDGHALSGWYEIEGKTYYFDSIGCMVTGQKAIGDGEYLFADSGELVRTVSGPAPEVLKAE